VRFSRRDAQFIGALLLLAWAIYRPDVRLPFHYVDFPENIRVLQAGDSFGERFASLMAVYREHGRWSPVVMGWLAAQWSWFEWWTPGWQLLRFVVCFSVAGLGYWMFRRLHLRPVGAFAAALLLVVSPVAVAAWSRPSAAEPVGALFLLLACHLAVGRHRGGRAWDVGFAALLLCLMWTKEMMAFAFALPAYLAIAASPEGKLGPARWDQRTASTLRAMLLGLAVGATPILIVYFTAPADAFAGRYGAAGTSAGELAGSLLAGLLPFAPVSAGSQTPVLAALTALAVLTLVGWSRSLKPGTDRAHPERLLLLALALPVLGAVVYAPWPFYLLVYAFPFAVAGALLVGQAVSSWGTTRGLEGVLAAACLVIAFSFSATQAANEAARTRALQQAVGASVIRVSEYSGVDSVLVGVARDQYDQRGNFGPRFWIYAKALGLTWPRVRDVPCEDAPREPTPGTLVLRLNIMCGVAPSSTESMTFPYYRLAWPDPRPRRDSVHVGLIQMPQGEQP
jgi:hypothetical protein